MQKPPSRGMFTQWKPSVRPIKASCNTCSTCSLGWGLWWCKGWSLYKCLLRSLTCVPLTGLLCRCHLKGLWTLAGIKVGACCALWDNAGMM
ncbi:hypothetical protein GDO78_020501 [Eleutherodactylus coqui]|uniref:Uncharacterized protein n=1 Tax=Eleutherodactylus coqui TaxID=57060 RepID=A0A8J6E5R9_ELECQ|nr:hypothetical protein GDO78_020501 [Eleutherodactylus coqui]